MTPFAPPNRATGRRPALVGLPDVADGAVLSAFATARELGSDLIGPDDDRLMKLSARLFRR